MDIALLARLRAADGDFVPLAELGGDAAVVQRDLDDLEAFGFGLERHPFRGVAYRAPAARLCPDQIEWELGTRRVGRRIAVWSRVASTNDLALRAAASQANDGLVILAEEQTAGRGRLGRSWSAPPASALLLSLLLFPPRPLAAPNWLTALGAVAAAEVVERWTGRAAAIKWPNDVRVGGRKIAGVLVERAQDSAVIGIGLNVNAGRADLPAGLGDRTTSLRILAGRSLDRSELARDLIRRLDAHLEAGCTHGPDPLDRAWQSRLEALGRDVCVETTDAMVVGRMCAAGLSAGVVLDCDGVTRCLPAAVIRAITSRDAESLESCPEAE